MVHLQCAINLVGRYVVEAFALISFRKALPIELSGLQQCESTHHIGLRKGKGVFNRAVYVALGGEVDNAVNFFILHQLIESLEVADVHLDELVVRLVLDILQVCQVTGIGKFVEVDDVILGVLVYKESHNVAANKAGTTGDDDIFHSSDYFLRLEIHFLNVL